MGYTNSRILRLNFVDRDGLIVRMRPASMGTMRWLIRNGPAIMALEGKRPSELSTSEAELLDHLFSLFADHLVSWNLEDEAADGTRTPVPADEDGVDSQEAGFIMELTREWQAAGRAVPPPLGEDSNSGDTSVERSLTMVPFSPNRAS